MKKITADEESEIIKENKKSPEAQRSHKFKQAVWTHPNGHPRCIICGDEERIGGICEAEEKLNLKQPNRSGIEKGNKIFLKDILKEFDDFKIKEPIAWIVGGLSNHGHTKGDIDILINLLPEEADTSISKVLRFRIQRSLPERYWKRIHWLYNEGAGPFTSNVPLFSLDAIKTKLQRQEMAAATSITPLKFFKQLKGKSGRFKKEIFSIKSLQEVIPEDAYPVEINQKYDGMRVQIHKADNKVKIWSEDGGNLTDRFPTFVEQIKKYPRDIVIDVEITGEIKGKPIGRSDVSGYAHKKETPDDTPFTANVHDILFLGKNDLHTAVREGRIKILKGIKLGDKYKIIPIRVARNKKELKAFVDFFSKQKGSEGAMIKQNDSIYELDGMTTKWWKYKKDFVIDAKVVDIQKIGEQTFSYLAVINDKIPIGKTTNTNIKAEINDIIQVAFGNLNKYTDDDKLWYNWVFPRVIGLQETKTKPDDTIEADLLNKESGGLIEEKPFPERFKQFLSQESLIKNIKTYDPKSVNNRILLDDHRITHAWAATILEGNKFKYTIKEVKQLHDITAKEIEARGFIHNTPIELPREAMQQLVAYRRQMKQPIDLALFDAFDEFMLVKRKLRFVYQHHWRGKSVHGDMRFQLPDRKALEGYTMAVQRKEETKEPITTLEKAQAEGEKDIYKINYKTGKTEEQKILIFTKANQPLVWLDQKGATKVAEPGAPPQPGATRFFPGVFDIIDDGFYEPGANKPFFKEYFIEGKIFSGRYIFRKLPSTKNIKDTGKEPFIWFFWRPEEQTPYILSTRALRKQDFMLDKSWLSVEWEKKIPSDLRWWEKDLSREEVTSMIKAARKKLMEENQLSENPEQRDKFVLDRHYWKGQKVIRDIPVEHWDLRFSLGSEFTLDKNPVFDPKDINAIYKKGFDIPTKFNIFDKDTLELKPGEKGNPNKKIPAFVEQLDTGTVDIISHTENFMSVEFEGKQLKGFFTFKRLDKGSQWLLTKGKLPQAMQIMLGDFEIEHILDLSDPQLCISRPDIARQVGCSPSAVYVWQKRAGL